MLNLRRFTGYFFLTLGIWATFNVSRAILKIHERRCISKIRHFGHDRICRYRSRPICRESAKN